MNEFNGMLEVLNVREGHMTFRFDRDDKKETEKARKVITDMLARGYSILVETDSGVHRVTKFNPKHDYYIVKEIGEDGKKKTKKFPMKTTKATGIGRTAGG